MHVVSTRDVILDTAEALFAERGYRGLSMRELAEGAGVSKANLYHHFAGKRDLYRHVLERALNTLELTLTQAAASEGTTRERLTRVTDASLNLLQHNRPLVFFFMREIGSFEREVRDLVIQHWEGMLEPIERVIEDGIARGELHPADPRLTALSVAVMLRGLITLQLVVGETKLDPDLADHTLDVLFEGIGAR
ncbi:MAG: TetR/AcrR family transcriptional regulator [Anaerolineae bacterium]